MTRSPLGNKLTPYKCSIFQHLFFSIAQNGHLKHHNRVIICDVENYHATVKENSHEDEKKPSMNIGKLIKRAMMLMMVFRFIKNRTAKSNTNSQKTNV